MKAIAIDGVLVPNATMQYEPSKATPQKRNYRWFQFSLRSLFGFTLGCAVAAAWLGAIWHAKLDERRIVEELRSDGAALGYDFEFDSGAHPQATATSAPGPAWLRNILGDDVFAAPTYVGIDNDCRNEGAALEKLGQLSSLTSADLTLKNSSSGPFRAVRALRKLKVLRVEGPLDCHDIVDLEPMPQLSGLSIWSDFDKHEPKFDDLACRHIQRAFPGLTNLVVKGRLSERGIESLSGMKALETLDIWVDVDTHPTRFVLHDCPALKEIHANYSDWGTACDSIELRNLPALMSLELTAYSVHIHRLPKLRSLDAGWPKDLQLDGVEGLEEISFATSELPADALAQLSKCPHLAVLDLRIQKYQSRAKIRLPVAISDKA